MQWDNTTLFSDDNPADRAFREEVRAWIAANCPKELCGRRLRIDPPERLARHYSWRGGSSQSGYKRHFILFTSYWGANRFHMDPRARIAAFVHSIVHEARMTSH